MGLRNLKFGELCPICNPVKLSASELPVQTLQGKEPINLQPCSSSWKMKILVRTDK